MLKLPLGDLISLDIERNVSDSTIFLYIFQSRNENNRLSSCSQYGVSTIQQDLQLWFKAANTADIKTVIYLNVGREVW